MAKNIVIFSDGTGQDGGTRPEQRWSNIYKMYRASRVANDTLIDPSEQVAFYDPGLGTDTTATGWTSLVRRVQKLLASVDGRGITTNIADCYEFIINHYEPGDRIYLFGFSRGAYTVRSVANLLMLCGIPTRGGDGGPLPRFRQAIRLMAQEAVTNVLEHGAGHPRETYEAERFELARRFRRKYGSEHESGETDRSNAAPYFVGVFDTVAALGASGARRVMIKAGLAVPFGMAGAAAGAFLAYVIGGYLADWTGFAFSSVLTSLMSLGAMGSIADMLWKQRKGIRKTIHDFPHPGDPPKHHRAEWKGEHFDRLLSDFVTYARSANAIDETRADFARVGWGKTSSTAAYEVEGHVRFRQLWFAGNHSDIGGSYPEVESRLSDLPLVWMIREATKIPHPLRMERVFEHGYIVENTGPKDYADQPDAAPRPVGQPLHVFPDAGGVQHCEVAGMSDFLDGALPGWLRALNLIKGWEVRPREINSEAVLHPSVLARFEIDEVPQSTGSGPYRPENLRNHKRVKALYAVPSEPVTSSAAVP